MRKIRMFAWPLMVVGMLCLLACDQSDITPDESAMNHTVYLSQTIGQRTAGTVTEDAARSYIHAQFVNIGYDVVDQPFSYEDEDGVSGQSANVIAVKAGASEKKIVVGGHYDSVPVGQGASDNAAAIGVMIAVADMIKNIQMPYTVEFVAYGAEEVGIFGSEYHASQMTGAELSNTIAMINLDTIVGGDKMYVYGGLQDGGWVRDQAISLAGSLGITLETNPGLNPDYPAGTTGPWSDHIAYEDRGIAIAYFETTNWEIGDLDGYMQTVKHGEIWHTENDTLAFLDAEFPGRTDYQLNGYLDVLFSLLVHINPPTAVLEQVKTKRTKPVKNRFEPNRGRNRDF